jgi:stage V sporulation protein R
VLKHEHDGRDLDLDYADKVMDHVREIWPHEVKLYTVIEEEVWEF